MTLKDDKSYSIEELTNFPTEFILSDLQSDRLNNVNFNKTVFFTENGRIGFDINANSYSYVLQLNNFTDKKSVIIICSKDNENILSYTLEKIKSYDLHKEYDILLVDDRSVSDSILSLAKEHNTSYIRINNDQNIFNYSIINNIAACYAKLFQKETLIFWNNDMWPDSYDSFRNIFDKHRLYKSGITGAKLIYPSIKEYEDIGKPQHLLEPYLDKIYSTIQHGGIHFIPKKSAFLDPRRKYLSSETVLAPSHTWRFFDKDLSIASSDNRCYSVTGALHIIDTDLFFEIGCLNIGLATAFQDIDLCIKALSHNKSIYYIGSETMVHGESLTNVKEKIFQSKELLSDELLWDILWGVDIPRILGFMR